MRELGRAGRIDVGQGGLGDPTAVIVVEGCCSKAVAGYVQPSTNAAL
jgi:hypothetical protein